jgi:hypothetical protein
MNTLRLGPVQFAPGVYAAAAALVITGLAITDAGLRWVSIFSYAVAGGLIIWGTTVNRRHLWQPWWRGPPNPFKIKAWSGDWRFEQGAEVGGIRWDNGYARIRVNLTNISSAVLEDVTARLAPDQPIIESRVRCKFAECKIASEFEPVDVTLRMRLKDGREVDISPGPHEQMSFGHPHRLFCERLPAGATIEINLATVVPLEPGSPETFKRQRTDPEYVDLALKWHIAGEYSTAVGRFALGTAEGAGSAEASPSSRATAPSTYLDRAPR